MKKEDRILFIGCGTGRCGTTSLAKLIAGCKDAVCHHERRPLLPWVFDEELFQERVKWFSTSTAGITGDVAYFYLPYIEKIMGVFPKLKVVCLERNRRAVIDSFMWKTRWQNRWYEHDGIEWAKDVVWDKTFPKYGGIKDKAEAIGAYWDEYRKEIRRIARNFPDNIKLLSIEELNKLEGQHQIFDFLEIPEKNRRYIQKPKYNARESGNLPWSKEDAFKWFQQRTLTAEDIASIIPPGTDFILVDQQQVKGYLPDQYRTVSFLEQDGVYWGPPPDDETAIRELNQLRRSGAQFIVFAWTAFWFLDYYTGLHSTLRSRYRCLIENDRIVCFDLRIAEQSNGELPPPMKKSAA